ncbi:hypothetical protein ACPTFC_25365 [Pseudomonas aeruginosa]|uniref:hypothetical protein n=1 Tax=Pseudomonas aeruginosa TaxID=287 RepID=UPI003CC51D2A
MRSIKSEDTAPELAVRRIVSALGYRYRLHRQDLPGKPDLVFIGRRKVVFVHGCFWHGHSCPEEPVSQRPMENTGILRSSATVSETHRTKLAWPSLGGGFTSYGNAS